MGTDINFSTSLGVNDGTRVNFNLVRSILLKSEGRAFADGGVVESELCSYNILNNLNYSALLKSASLVITPNSVKESKLYSVIPSDGSGDLSVTRATTATRVNSAGLVELVPYNLLPNSNNFSLSWTRANTTIVSSNNAAPDGSLTATRLSMPNGSSSQLYNGFPTVAATYTTSIWIRLVSGTGNFKLGFFDNVSILTNSITVTSTWQRFSVTKTLAASAGARGCWLYSDDTNQVIEVWSGQVVDGDETKDYYPTTTRLNIPRLDYANSSCPSILVEPQRTNLVTDSETYSSTWGSNFASITKNLLSPSGITNASTIVNSVGSNKSIFKVISVVSGNTYKFSIYIKKISGAFVNSSAIQLTSWGSGVASQTYTELGTTVTTDWVRYTHTFTATSTATVYIQLISNEIHTFGLWGAQLEAGAYTTSYIPTTSASVTRNLDVISKTGISSLLNPGEGTFFVEASTLQGTEEKAIQLSNGSDLNVVMLHYYGGNEVRCTVVGGSSTYLKIVSTNVNNVKKMAVSWKSTGVFLYINGVEYSVPLTAGSGGGVPSTLDRLTFSYWWGGFPFLTNTKAVGVWKNQLTSAQCIALTTV